MLNQSSYKPSPSPSSPRKTSGTYTNRSALTTRIIGYEKKLDEPLAIVLAALITGICVLLATIPAVVALVPSFGQWLIHHPIIQVTSTLTIIPTPSFSAPVLVVE